MSKRRRLAARASAASGRRSWRPGDSGRGTTPASSSAGRTTGRSRRRRCGRRGRRSSPRSSRSRSASRARRTTASRCAPGRDRRRDRPRARSPAGRGSRGRGSAGRRRRCCRCAPARATAVGGVEVGHIDQVVDFPRPVGLLVDGGDLDLEHEAHRRAARRRQRCGDRLLDSVAQAKKAGLGRHQLSLSSAHQAGWVKSPVATTAMPLRPAQAARCSRSRSRLVAREYFEWTCRSAWKRMRATPSSPDPGGRAAIKG